MDEDTQTPVLSELLPQHIDTSLTWDDLVLDSDTLQAVERILALGAQQEKQGIINIFHGPQGTGKTLTACLIGKKLGRPAYRVDLSTVVSKDLQETRDNLTTLLREAQRQGWLLLLDDASNLLFSLGVHGSIGNEIVTCLMQSAETVAGIVILKTGPLYTVAAALAACPASTILFGMPGFSSRLRLWKGYLGSKCTLSPEIDLVAIARDYELAGGAIVNVVRSVCLRIVESHAAVITLPDLLECVQRELHTP